MSNRVARLIRLSGGPVKLAEKLGVSKPLLYDWQRKGRVTLDRKPDVKNILERRQLELAEICEEITQFLEEDFPRL